MPRHGRRRPWLSACSTAQHSLQAGSPHDWLRCRARTVAGPVVEQLSPSLQACFKSRFSSNFHAGTFAPSLWLITGDHWLLPRKLLPTASPAYPAREPPLSRHDCPLSSCFRLSLSATTTTTVCLSVCLSVSYRIGLCLLPSVSHLEGLLRPHPSIHPYSNFNLVALKHGPIA